MSDQILTELATLQLFIMSKNTQGVEKYFDYNMTVLKEKLQTFDKEQSAV